MKKTCFKENLDQSVFVAVPDCVEPFCVGAPQDFEVERILIVAGKHRPERLG